MNLSLSFKFVDDALNAKLIGLVNKAGISHSVDDAGVIHYSSNDEAIMENDLISSVRSLIYDFWQVLTCPQDWTERYQEYMIEHHIPFNEELIDGELCFIIPRKYRPHLWKLSNEKIQKKKVTTKVDFSAPVGRRKAV